MYCQRQIEGQNYCDKQCTHCKMYYEPIETDHAACDYANQHNQPDEPEWHIAVDAFLAGVEYAKKHILINENESDRIF